MDERKFFSPIRATAPGAPTALRTALKLVQEPLAEPASPSAGYLRARKIIESRAETSSLFELFEMLPCIFRNLAAVGLMTDTSRPGYSRYVRGFVDGSYVDAIVPVREEADEMLLKGTHQTVVPIRSMPRLGASMTLFSKGHPELRNGHTSEPEAGQERQAILAHMSELYAIALHSRIGSLTFLPNTAMFEAAAAAAETAYYNDDKHFSLVLADIDGLKNINYDQGYAAGDMVLAAVADRLRNSLADLALKGSVLFRPGKSKFLHGIRKDEEAAANPELKHDEFALLLPGYLDEALIAERLRHEIASRPIMLEAPIFSIAITTCSFGVATSTDLTLTEGTLWRRMLDVCIHRLGIAKSQGGNRIIC